MPIAARDTAREQKFFAKTPIGRPIKEQPQAPT